jgi:hypothetical protein
MAWEVIVRPEKSRLGLINSLGSESIILLINALMVRVAMPNTGEEELENLGLAIVAFMILCCVWNYACWLIYVGMGVYARVQRCRNPPTEKNAKNADKYIPPPAVAQPAPEEEKSGPNVTNMQSTLHILDNSATLEKDQPPEPMLSLPQPPLKRDNENGIVIMQPGSFFKETPSPAPERADSGPHSGPHSDLHLGGHSGSGSPKDYRAERTDPLDHFDDKPKKSKPGYLESSPSASHIEPVYEVRKIQPIDVISELDQVEDL